MHIERNTSQKEVILDYLRGTRTHPSARSVYSAVRKKLPRISLGTVYRNLNNLKLKQKVLEIPSSEFRYDGDISPHGHFICQKCSQVYDIFDICKKCRVLNEKKIKVGKINRFQIYFYGECKKCRKK